MIQPTPSKPEAAQLLAASRHCCRKGCIRLGEWLPMIVVRLRGQTAVERPVKTIVPMYLCAVCKEDFEPHQVISLTAFAKLTLSILIKRGRRPNWDTIDVEWVSRKDIEKIVLDS